MWEAGKSAWTTPRFPVAVRERCGNKDRRGGLEPPNFFCHNYAGLMCYVSDVPIVSLLQDPPRREENTPRCLIGRDLNSWGGSRSRLSSVHRDVFLPVLRHGVIRWLRARSAPTNMGGRIWGVADSCTDSAHDMLHYSGNLIYSSSDFLHRGSSTRATLYRPQPHYEPTGLRLTTGLAFRSRVKRLSWWREEA